MRSPVVILGSPRRSARIFPCVPFPEPGAPRMRMNTKVPALAAETNPRGAAASTATLHEAVVLAQQQMLLHLLYRIERHPDDDEQRRAAEPERHVECVLDDDRQQGDEREEERARQRNAGQHFIDVIGGRRAPLPAGDERTLLLEVLL